MHNSVKPMPTIEKKDYVLFCLVTFLYLSFYLPMGSSIPTIALLGYHLLKNRFKISLPISFFVVYLLAFVAFCYLTCLWAKDTYYVLLYSNHVLKTMFGIFVLYVCLLDKPAINLLLKSIVWGGYIMMFYMVAYYGINGVINMINESERMTNEAMNANTFAMCMAYACIIHVFLGITERWRLAHLFIIPAAVLLAVSGSRKGLIILVGGILCVVMLHTWRKEHSAKSLLKIFGWLLIISLGFVGLLNLPAFSVIKDRMMSFLALLTGDSNVDNSLLSRSNFIEVGISIFKEHPLLGVGIDNARLFNYRNVYLHNNFVEMLADGGLIGFGIYYSLYIYLFVGYIKNRKTQSKYYSICFVLLTFMTAIHYAFVSYKMSGEYYMLLMLFMQLQHCKKDEAQVNWLDETNAIEKGN